MGSRVGTQRETKETKSEEGQNFQKEKWEELWEVGFWQLVDYKQVHGDCNVPKRYKANPQLGSWVGTQRRKEETVSEEKRKRLDSIGFIWKLRATPVSVDWKVRFKQLEEYKRVHGNCNVPQRYQPNPQLGTWVNNQRTKEETTSENKRNQLNSIGFVWGLKAG